MLAGYIFPGSSTSLAEITPVLKYHKSVTLRIPPSLAGNVKFLFYRISHTASNDFF